jgi:aerobic-type carbon monoxide dehydrogenase small subunit (CoxS/CutS family)
MDGYCSTGQSPQRAVATLEEEEEEEEEEVNHSVILLLCNGTRL